MRPLPSLAIVVPMYNEERGAERCVRAICEAIDGLANRSALIVVDDGSRDGTRGVLERLAPELPRMIAVSHDRNRGYGRALRTGTQRASEMDFEYVLFMDSDLTNDPRYLPAFASRMAEGYDIIKASRYVSGGAVLGVPRWRRAISIAGNRVASRLYGLGIRDCTNGFRAGRTAILRQMHLRENGFAIIMEELYQARFLARRFCEIPNTLTARTDALRPSSFAYGPLLILDYLKYPLKAALGWRPRDLGPASEEGDATHSL